MSVDDDLHLHLARTEDAWKYLNSDLSLELFGRPWYELEERPSWEDFTRYLRDRYGYYEQGPQPQEGADFLNCLTWYFYDCTVRAGLNIPAAWNGSDTQAIAPEDYCESLETLFRDFYPMFYGAYVELREKYIQDSRHSDAYSYPDTYAAHVHESGVAAVHQPENSFPEEPADTADLVHEVLDRFADPNGDITAAEVQQVAPYVTAEELDTLPR